MATAYENTGGSGDRTATITQTNSTGLFAYGTPTNLINGNTSESNLYLSGSVTDGWIKWDFGVGAAKYITELKWYQDVPANHGLWKIQASNNDSDWTDVSNAFNLSRSGATSVANLAVPLDNGYRYYKIVQVSGTTSSSPYVREVEFKIGDSPDEGLFTSYGNTGGQGDRSAIITLTTSTNLFVSPNNIFNGLLDMSAYFNGGITNGWATFDFGAGAEKVIDEIRWYQSSATSQGTWKVRGSNNNSDWTDITEISDFGNQASTSVYSFSNTTGYRYYQLYQTGGTTSNGPYVYEVDFKIGDFSDSVTFIPFPRHQKPLAILRM